MLSELKQRKMVARLKFHDVTGSGTRTESDFTTVVDNLATMLDVAGSEKESQIRTAIMAEWDVLKTTADLDGDGAVSQKEWLAHCERMLNDENVFNAVTKSAANTLFDILDNNRDDKLSVDEMILYYKANGQSEELARSCFAKVANGEDQLSRERVHEALVEFYRSEDESAGELEKDYSMDSMDAVDITDRIEVEFDMQIETKSIYIIKTIGDLLDVINGQQLD